MNSLLQRSIIGCLATALVLVCAPVWFVLPAIAQDDAGAQDNAAKITSQNTSLSTYRDEQAAFKTAVAAAESAVVRIETFGGLEVVDSKQVNARTSTGTIVGSDGWIVSSLFAFRNEPASTTVLLPDGTRKGAKIIARDFSRELILLKIDVDEPLPTLQPVDRSEMVIGQWTIALGRTFAFDQVARSSGILSATNRIWDKAIQSDAKISPINYGGPLIDLNGRCLGILAPINPGIATEGEVQQWYDSGIGFAIPLVDILERLPRLKQGNDIYDGKLGIRMQRVGDFSGPIKLAGVTPGSPAAKSGFRKDDVVIKVGMTPVGTSNELKHALGPYDDGAAVALTVERDDDSLEIEATLVAEIPIYREPFLGVLLGNVSSDRSDADTTVEPTTPETASQTDGNGPKGVRVVAILADSPAANSNLDEGDVVIGLNGEAVGSVSDFSNQIAFVDFRDSVTLQVKKSGSGEAVDVACELMAQPSSPFDSVPVRPLDGGEANAVTNSSPRSETDDESKEAKPEAEKDSVSGPSEIVLSDLPNKGFRFVPSNYAPDESFGLLFVAAEAGAMDQKQWIDRWEVFCRERRFVLVVLDPGPDEKWAFEDTDVIRRVVKTQMTKLRLDDRRQCIGGFGTGGTLAFVTAFEDRERVQATFVIQGRVPGLVRMPNNEPLESLRLFVAGDRDEYEKVEQQFDEHGFAIARVSESIEAGQMLAADSIDDLQRWLALLEWL